MYIMLTWEIQYNHSVFLTQSMHGSKYVTNHQLEKDIGCKVLQFINTTCSVVTMSHFQCMAPSMWQTNRCTNPSTWLTTNLRRMLAAKFFSSSTRWRSRSLLITKPYSVQIQQLFEEKDKLGHMSLVTICLWNFFALSCIHLHQLWRPLK